MARVDPIQGFNFVLDVNGLKGYFTSVDGLGSENEVTIMKTINKQGQEVQVKVPGRLNWGDVTLKRGLSDDLEIWNWRQMIVDGKVVDARKNCSISMLSLDGELVVTWSLVNAWPSKVSSVTLSSDSNDFIIEEVTLVHEGISRDDKNASPKRG